VLGVRAADLWLTGIFGGLVVLVVLAFYKEFLVLSFDETLAVTLRLPVRLLNYLLMILIAVAIVVSLQTVGVALMVAMLVTPAATAYLLTRRLPVMMGLASLIGALSGVVGLYLSFHLGVASGAAVVLVCTGAFLIAFLFAPGRGVVWAWLRRARLRRAGT
jgi:ABC-type Mn2+/Zn2+ transport system permease subunit